MQKVFSIVAGILISGLLTVACTNRQREIQVGEKLELPGGKINLLVISEDAAVLKDRAQKQGLRVSGDVVLQISGDSTVISRLNISEADEILLDTGVRRMEEENSSGKFRSSAPDEQIYYLAQKELGVADFKQKNPTYDGRGVKVAVLDNGISPHQSGFLTTSTGERKVIFHWTEGDSAKLKLNVGLPAEPSKFVKALAISPETKVWSARYEEALHGMTEGVAGVDINRNGKKTDVFDVVVTVVDSVTKVCIDSNADDKVDATECFGTFNAYGAFGWWNLSKDIVVMAEFDAEKGLLELSQGEDASDSHGEGVAAVVAGHQLAGKFDGLAPGAQILDLDFTGLNDSPGIFPLGGYLEVFEVAGKNGAEVANLSYSLFFESAATQAFAKKAFDALITKYNMVLCFSAGNNGPGLGSLNRRMMYPDNSLVTGAYASKEMMEYVHGVTGLPDQGVMISYSSRGPGPEEGYGPLTIAPLASLGRTPTGYQAFSGTSSASPASAGAATVLISAIKQQGLKVNAGSIVQALRLSAKSLANISFADQGYGLPNVERALLIYKDLIAGKGFQRVDVTLKGETGVDGVARKGMYYPQSHNLKLAEAYVDIKGVASALATEAQKNEMFAPLLFKYSHSWIKGPSRLWLASTTSRATFAVDFEAMRAEVGSAEEVHGKIELIDENTGALLHVIPVIALQPKSLDQIQSYTVPMNVAAGTRGFFNVGEGVQGLAIEVDSGAQNNVYTYLAIYNPSGTRTQQLSLSKRMNTFFIATPTPGLWQIAFSKYSSGTELDQPELKVKVTPIAMRLETKALDRGLLAVNLTSKFALPAVLSLQKSRQILKTELLKVTEYRALELPVDITEAGIYDFTVTPANTPMMTNPTHDEYLEYYNTDGKLMSWIYKTNDVFKVDPVKPGKYVFKAGYFEMKIGDIMPLTFIGQVSKRDAVIKNFAMTPAYLQSGNATYTLTPDSTVPAKDPMDLILKPVGGDTEINLGSML